MRKHLRLASNIAASGIVFLLLVTLFALIFIQTQWFRHRVRQHIIAAVQGASGGRVELKGFSFDWRTMTATARGFVVHGTESAFAPPLFRSPSIHIQLQVLSVFERKLAVSDITLDQPELNIQVAPDGSTNIPTPDLRSRSAASTVEDLMNLKLHRFTVTNGIIRTGWQTIPVAITSNDTSLFMTYNRATSTYSARVKSPQVFVARLLPNGIGSSLDAQVRLQKGRLTLDSAKLASAESTLEAAGTLRDFDRPVIDLDLKTTLTADQLHRFVASPDLRAGRFTMRAAFHRENDRGFQLSGDVTAQSVALGPERLHLKNCSLSSRFSAAGNTINFSNAVLRIPWGEFRGDATLAELRRFSVRGQIAGVKVGEILKEFATQDIQWSAIGAGGVVMSGTLNNSGKRPVQDLVAEAKLDLTPSSAVNPASGHVEATYHQAASSISLANSYFDLPHTHVMAAGILNQRLNVTVDSTNLDELRRFTSAKLPNLIAGGSAHFAGNLNGPLDRPLIDGDVQVSGVTAFDETWNRVRAHAQLSSNSAVLTSLLAESGSAHISGSATVPLRAWSLNPEAPASLHVRLQGVPADRLSRVAHLDRLHVSAGVVSGTADLQGALDHPEGSVHLALHNAAVYSQAIDQAAADLRLSAGRLQVSNGTATSGPARLKFSGEYLHNTDSWTKGQLHFSADSNAFPLTTVAIARNREPMWNAQVELHVDAGVRITDAHIEPSVANGTVIIRRLSEEGQPLGNATLDLSTKADVLYAGFAGEVRAMHVKGNAQVNLVPGSPLEGSVQFDHADLRTLYSLLRAGSATDLPVTGSFNGVASFQGLLTQPERLHGSIHLDALQLSSTTPIRDHSSTPALVFHNSEPVVLNVADGRLFVERFQLSGPETSLSLSGSGGYLGQHPLDLRTQGVLDLRLFQLFQSGVQTSGHASLSAVVTGTAAKPLIDGSLGIQNGSLIATGFPNELTAVSGRIRFSRDRATIEKLTAQTGGGNVSVGGFVDLASAGQLTYRLEGSADNVRLRYANSVSVSANANLRLAGTSRSSVLSGTTTVSRVVVTPNADIGNLLASTFAPSPTAVRENDFLTGLQLDLHVQSAPDLQVTTELSRDLQTEIDLRVRGTPEHPVLFGDIQANQGDIRVFGAKYSINRGEVRFVNAARIVPVLDLDLQTITRGITVDVTIAGTPGKLNINYRSDPPLQPRDILALLTIGRVPDTGAANANIQSTTDTAALQYGANSVIGQAMSPVSNRLSKLFGITNVKIDPFVQGLTYAPQARLTLEEQISREIVVTYVTNLSQTSEQIFRVEWAFSPQYSVVALRDDNGEFGLDLQYRKRFK